MRTHRDEIVDQALSLDPGDRAALAHELIQSLDPAHEDPDVVERAWAEEIERRILRIRSGGATLIPAEEVLSEARRRLG